MAVQQYSPCVHGKPLIVHRPMFVFRQPYNTRHHHRIRTFLELRIDSGTQVADELQIFCRVLLGSAILCIRQIIVRVHGPIKFQFEDIFDCPRPLSDVEVRNDAEHHTVRRDDSSNTGDFLLRQHRHGHTQAVVHAQEM